MKRSRLATQEGHYRLPEIKETTGGGDSDWTGSANTGCNCCLSGCTWRCLPGTDGWGSGGLADWMIFWSAGAGWVAS